MDSGLYAACAGLMARTQELDTIASNLANASSAGFQGQKNVFGSVLAEAVHHGQLSALNQVTNSYGMLAGTELDESPGTLTKTGNPLDLGLEGPGYFKIRTANGIAYTRNGSFQVSTKGQLSTASGDLVMGEGGPLLVGTGTVSISPDGTVSTNGAIVGRLKVVAFGPAATPLSRGNGYYAADAAAEKPAVGTAVRQGSIESSNVSSIDGVVELVNAQRSAETMRHVLSMLDSEMDKTAAQDLSKVS